jgi:hypothetical protein
VIITYEGQQYPFDMDDIGVKQGIKIESFMGCSFEEWGKKLQAGDLKARQALGWVILTGGDLSVPVEDTDFKMVALANALNAAFEAEAAKAAAEAEPVPTGAVSNGHRPAAELSLPSSPESSGGISR